MILCAIAYLGLALVLSFCLPDQLWLSWILLLFAVHTAAYLVVARMKEQRGGKSL